MRPDAVNWANTNGLSALEFRPKQLVHRRVVRWAVRAALVQAVFGAALSLGAWHLLSESHALRGTASVSAPATAAAAAPATPATRISPTRRTPAQPTAAATGVAAPAAGTAKASGAGSLAAAARALADVPPLVAAAALAAGGQLAALLLAQFILLPIVRSIVRAHSTGLRELFDAIRSMASGVVPKPLPAGAAGEAGHLALAFNDMISRVIAGRKALVEANEMLERRVQERTRELQEANEKLERMACTDALTGLANRRALMQKGELLFRNSVYADTDFVLFLIDLDHFKSVNDTLGHKKGDELISLAASVLRNGCRTDDLAARLGGDEFMVLMPRSDLTAVAAKAEEFQSEFQGQVKALLGGEGLSKMPSMSIGMTSRRQAAATTFAELVQRADLALYRAKDLGRGRAEVYTPRADARAA